QDERSLNTAELSVANKLSVYGTTDPRYRCTRSGCSCTASENEQKMIPSLESCSLNVVATETLSNTASTATPARSSRSRSGTPSFSYVLRSSGSTSSRLFGPPFFDFGAE